MAGCFDTHPAPPECSITEPPQCRLVLTARCCGDFVDAACDESWSCPVGSIPASECTGIAPDCLPTLPDGGPPSACHHDTDCTLVSRDCCLCHRPTLDDVRAVAIWSVAGNATCDAVSCGCTPLPNPYLRAQCGEDAECVVVDLSAHPITACNDDDDCIVRSRTCCECAGVGESRAEFLIAINRLKIEDYQSMFCEGCPDCARPSYASYRALCAETGYCFVEEVP